MHNIKSMIIRVPLDILCCRPAEKSVGFYDRAIHMSHLENIENIKLTKKYYLNS
jgi:hypothetical protein